jgi:AcrR family transcriptional regulator
MAVEPGRRTRSDGRATRDLIVKVARDELKQSGPVAFNLDWVIETSGVSRSSIYHHFGNRAGVITAAETVEMLSDFRKANEATREAVENSANGEEFIDFVRMAFELGGGKKGRKTRARRIATLAAGEQIPALREVLSEAQVEGMDAYVATLELAVERGLVNPLVPVRGVAHLIQSVLLGRALVDLVDDPEIDAEWMETVVAGVRELLRPQTLPSS